MGGFKEIIIHSRNYLGANLATKALSFISIPILTRILTTEDFGTISIFLGVVGILASVMSFSMDRSISRYFFDQKSTLDFKQFVGTSSTLAISAFIINSIVLFFFAERFGDFVGLNKNLVYLIIPVSFINIFGLMFQQIYGPLKKSKEIAISSLSKVYLGVFFSIIFMLILDFDKYYGYILGQILSGIFLIIYWKKKIKPFFLFSFKRKFIKYIFTFSVPLIPYVLSGVIIAQFSKIAIGNAINISQAGFYSLALTISGLVQIAIAVTHQAWNPYFYEYMNSKNYIQIDIDFRKIYLITIFVAILISAFGKEIGLVLAKGDFTGSLYLIPILTVGYIFYQFSYTYLRNFGYSKKTYLSSITVLLSGLLNVFMNIYLINIMGELGAAISFVFSYIFMALIGWIFNKYFVKLHTTHVKVMLVPLLKVIPFYLILYFSSFINSILLLVLFKMFLVCSFTIILFWNDKNEIKKYFNPIFIRK